MHPLQTRPAAELPRRVPFLIKGFCWYARRFVGKHFHAVRISRSGSSLPSDGEPVLLVLNHPSWWDPMIAAVLSDLFPGYEHYAAVDPRALEQYRIFSRLGFVGVEPGFRGAARFLRTGEAILGGPRRAFWVTAQGQFTDVRTRPLGLRPGVGHLAARVSSMLVIPVALEYVFWTERTPEALVRFADPLRIDTQLSGKECSARIEAALTANLDCLSAEAVTRDASKFETLVIGRTGVGGLYDAWRRVRSWVVGRQFIAEHEAGLAHVGAGK